MERERETKNSRPELTLLLIIALKEGNKHETASEKEKKHNSRKRRKIA